MVAEFAHDATLNGHASDARAAEPVAIRRIRFADLRDALRQGWADFADNRSDIVVLCLLYPALGLFLGRLAVGGDVLPVLFPLISGFALLGPLVGIGLYEISRRRELGEVTGWRGMFGVMRRPAFGAIVLLGLVLAGIFGVWMETAGALWQACFGPLTQHLSLREFLAEVFATPTGWALIVAGNAIGAVFAMVVLCIGVFSFPVLVDEPAGRGTAEQLALAIGISVQAMAANARVMLGWGVLVGAILAAASVPLLVGLAVAIPLLGHATWHLYRRTVVRR
jgi:uncharacterized membrane protein